VHKHPGAHSYTKSKAKAVHKWSTLQHTAAHSYTKSKAKAVHKHPGAHSYTNLANGKEHSAQAT